MGNKAAISWSAGKDSCLAWLRAREQGFEAAEIVRRGIRARIVCVDTRWLDASFCGVDYDGRFLALLPAGVCPCGEDGEFHSFVFGAPGFAAPLAIVNGAQRRVRSVPPLAPTALVLQSLALVGA